jgi:hypothetical protein
MPTTQDEFDALLSYRWRDWVEASLRRRGIDPSAQADPHRFLQNSCTTEFSITRRDVVDYLAKHGIPGIVANTDPARAKAEGHHVYRVGDKWRFEYIEKATSCIERRCQSFEEALRLLVNDCFPYLRE